MTWDPRFETAFDPKAIAVVGATRDTAGAGPMGGTAFIAALQQLGYPGRIFPVNPNAEEIRGLTCYPNLGSIPQPAELVIVSVPREILPRILQECADTGNRNVHVFTAGFEETATDKGRELALEVRRIAQQGELRMLGPNCMGVAYVPRSRVTVWDGVVPTPGNVGFISQSGGHVGEFCRSAPRAGVYFSKAISYGNAYVIDSTDLLEYFAKDPETDIVTIYMEGIKDGRKLFSQVQSLGPRKPVVLWKGGLTQLGARAASSHTASLAGDRAIWDAFYKQTGAIRASSAEEMTDASLALLYLPPPKGRGVAVLVGGGGNSVWAADICSSDGLDLPTLRPETQERVQRVVPEAGTSVRNPLDAGMVYRNVKDLEQAIEAVYDDPLVDMLVLVLNVAPARGGGTQSWAEDVDYLCRFVSQAPQPKPLAVVLTSWANPQDSLPLASTLQERLLKGGIPVFASLARASRALSRLAGYYEYYRERSIPVEFQPLTAR